MINMEKRYHKNLLIILIIITFLTCPLVRNTQTAFALSIEEETELSRKFLESIKKNYEIVDEAFVREFINELGNYLTTPLEIRHFPFNFYVINDNDLNAFAGPGGHVFIFTGLIMVMDDIDELAGVISHEIAHVSSRHLSERIDKAKIIGLATLAGVLAGTMLGGKAAAAVVTGSQAAAIQKQLQYSRDDERQADLVGFKYLNETGFKPSGFLKILSKLQQGAWGIGSTPPYLLSHPTGSERMSNIEAIIESAGPPKNRTETAKFRELYPLFRTLIIARYQEPDEAESRFKKELETDPRSPLANFGMGIILKDGNDHSGAIEHFKEALEELPQALPIYRYLGETYQLQGKDQEGLQVFEKALTIDPRDKSTLFLMAMSYQDLEEYSMAVRIFERLVSMEPVQDEVFYNLGVALGRQEKLGPAHYNFGLFFKRLKEKEKADFHFNKALEFAAKDPSLTARIRKAMEKDSH